MSDRGFDRTIFNRLEQPVSSDWNQVQSQLDRALRDVLNRVYAGRVGLTNDNAVEKSGFIGDGFKVRPHSPASMVVVLTPGLGFEVVAVDPGSDAAVGSIAGLSDLSRYKPLALEDYQSITIDAAHATLDRYDLIEVKADRRLENTQAVNIYDSAGKVFIPAAPPKEKTLAWDLLGRIGTVQSPADSTAGISVKKGVNATAGTATVPTVTTGYVSVAVVFVKHAIATLPDGYISDERPLLLPSGVGRMSCKISMPTTGVSLAPTVSGLIAPPGVEVVARGLSVSGGEVQLSVIGGGQMSNFRARATVESLPTGEATAVPIPVVATAPTVYQMSGSDVTNFNDATLSHPTRLFMEKQWAASFGMRAVGLTGAAAPAYSALTDPIVYYVTAEWTY